MADAQETRGRKRGGIDAAVEWDKACNASMISIYSTRSDMAISNHAREGKLGDATQTNSTGVEREREKAGKRRASDHLEMKTKELAGG